MPGLRPFHHLCKVESKARSKVITPVAIAYAIPNKLHTANSAIIHVRCAFIKCDYLIFIRIRYGYSQMNISLGCTIERSTSNFTDQVKITAGEAPKSDVKFIFIILLIAFQYNRIVK